MRLTSSRSTHAVVRSHWMLAAPWSMWIGRGRPSRPRRSQSHSLNVKMYGVALISSTMLSAPEQCTVPAGNQEVVVLLRRPAVHVALVREAEAARPARGAGRGPSPRGSTPSRTPRYTQAPSPGVEQVVALVLRVVHPEAVLDVLGQRVHLQREVAAAHRVEEVEADRELVAEARVDGLAEQRAAGGGRRGRSPAPRRARRRSRAAGCSPPARSRSTRRSSARRAGGRRPPSSTGRPRGRGRRTARRGTAAAAVAASPAR